MVYQIKAWRENFETSKSKGIKNQSYYPCPLTRGRRFERLMINPEGAMAYGIFHLLVSLVASQQIDMREGWLTDDGTSTGDDYDAEDLSIMLRRPVEEIENALSILTDPKIGWIIQRKESENATESAKPNEINGNLPRVHEVPCCEKKFLEGKGREGKDKGREGKEKDNAQARPDSGGCAAPAASMSDSAGPDSLPSRDDDGIAWLVELWNRVKPGECPSCRGQRMKPDHRASCLDLLSTVDRDKIEAVFISIKYSDFLCGRKKKKHDFRASLPWVAREFERIEAGEYHDPQSKKTHDPTYPRQPPEVACGCGWSGARRALCIAPDADNDSDDFRFCPDCGCEVLTEVEA